jgi:SOS-response transcriptional repressor LexA
MATEFQARLLNYISSYVEKNGYSPSFREMSKEMGCGMGKLYYNLSSLKKRRRITHARNMWRGIELDRFHFKKET